MYVAQDKPLHTLVKIKGNNQYAKRSGELPRLDLEPKP